MHCAGVGPPRWRNYQGQANSIAATIRRTPTPSPKSEDELQHLRRKPKMSPHSPLRNPKTNPHSLAATMTNSNSLATTLRRTPTPSPQPQGYEITELEARCEQKLFTGRKWASRPCYSSPRHDFERSRANESLLIGPGVEIESGGPVTKVA